MTVVECHGCGHRLELPAGFREAGDFACAHCGLWMRNVEAARAFRWAKVDPYVRRHGASRLNLWGGFLGSVLWLPIVLALMAARDALTAPLALAVALPYLALMLWLVRRRAGVPAMLWIQWLWAGLGAYLVYLWAMFRLVPGWRGLLERIGVPEGESLAVLGGLGRFGAMALGIGLLGTWLYRRRVRRLPHMRGAAPEA